MRIVFAFIVLAMPVPVLAQQAEQLQNDDSPYLETDIWTMGVPGEGELSNMQPLVLSQLNEHTIQPTPSLATDSSDDPSDEDGSSFQIGAIGVVGATSMDIERFSPVVESFIGRDASQEDLASLTQQIADIAREDGYIFASAYIPEQAIQMGVVEIKLIEGMIDEVRIIGSDNRHLRKLLAPLEGKIARRGAIERAILLAGDTPKIRVRSSEFLQEDGRNILQVKVKERGDTVRLRADNYGTDSFGPIRARISTDIKGVINDADALGVAIRTNPLDPEEILSVSGYYESAVGTSGLTAGVAGSVGDTVPGGRSAGASVSGASRYASVFSSYPLIRESSGSLWIDVEAAYLSIEKDDLTALIREDTEVTMSFGVRGEFPLASGRFRAGASITQGFDIFGATRFGNPLASRGDGDGVFTKGEYWADFKAGLTNDLSLYLAARGQTASRPLLAAQEISIGGAYRVRGYDFSELSGDEGVYGLAEIRYDFKRPAPWLKKLQLYGFIDAGYVNDIRQDFSEGTLVSAGPGVRGTLGPFDIELETALPINRDRDSSGDKDPHLNVSIGTSF